MNKHVIIVHYHELSLKGKNRNWFEKTLLKNIKRHLYNLPFTNISRLSGRMIIEEIDSSLLDQYINIMSNVIGIRNFILAAETPLDLEQIKNKALEASHSYDKKNSFRISSRRQNKNFKFTTRQINQIVGQHIVDQKGLKVNLDNPDLDILIEIVNDKAFIGTKKIRTFGGLPVGTGESALSLISSGIDSPVASFNIIKRGVSLDYIHFHSAPATSRQSIYNVESILKQLCRYQMNCTLYLFPLLDIQNIIMDQIDSKYWVVLFRRAMIKIANKVAKEYRYKVLISGENIGQVASQTLSNIATIDDASSIPIIRPLAGHNKEEIVDQAEIIDTYQISIEPYQDCCSYFVPPNPETKSNLDRIQRLEKKFNLDEMINDYRNKIEVKEFSYYEK
tara:strand:+ start:2698 stop:3873 length:1176 start_codon:yes stop_codon:yes gene_type:complete